MNTPIIQVTNVSKLYYRTEHRPSLRHEAVNILRRTFQGIGSTDTHQFYALREVSFSVQQGEGIGIIGRNGSGKTTLLRLLSGIMRPTSGSVSVRGRFAALIGLGAGFLPELPGRKNIYLNAAIHGVPPHKVDHIVDAIIDFAEIRAFIDTPIKYYSSGMNARLGFSIAVHILPEIVFLDEILAVGDLAFQEKCKERLLQLKAANHTFVVVSHTRAALDLLCERTLWLNDGLLVADGPTDAVFEQYSQTSGVHTSQVNDPVFRLS